jgi:hypothetical protein
VEQENISSTLRNGSEELIHLRPFSLGVVSLVPNHWCPGGIMEEMENMRGRMAG